MKRRCIDISIGYRFAAKISIAGSLKVTGSIPVSSTSSTAAKSAATQRNTSKSEVTESDSVVFSFMVMWHNNTANCRKSSPSRQVTAKEITFPSDLRALVEAWPTLLDALKSGILAMVNGLSRKRSSGLARIHRCTLQSRMESWRASKSCSDFIPSGLTLKTR